MFSIRSGNKRFEFARQASSERFRVIVRSATPASTEHFHDVPKVTVIGP